MIERLFRMCLLITPAVWLAACASTPQVDPALTAAVSSHGVDQSTYTKISQGWALDYDDVLDLVKRDVPTHIIISYLQSTQRAYNLSNAQLQGLKSAGAT